MKKLKKEKKKDKKHFDPWEFVNTLDSIIFNFKGRENLPSIWKGHDGFNWKTSRV